MNRPKSALLQVRVPGRKASVRVYSPAAGKRSYRVVWREADGTQRETTRLSLREAEDAAVAVADNLASATAGTQPPGASTLGDLVDHYLYGPGRSPRCVAPRSVRRLEQTARRILSAEDLDVPVQALDGPSGVGYLTNLLRRNEAKGLAAGGQEYEKAGLFLKSVLDAGVRDGLVELRHGNPMQHVPYRRASFALVPRGHLAAVDYVGPEQRPSTDEVRRLITAAAALFGDEIALLLAAIAFAGLRPGEALALTAGQVGRDPLAPRVLVNRQFVELRRDEVDSGDYGDASVIVTAPKHHLTRSPFVTPDVFKQLRSLADHRAAEAGDEALLFRAPGGRPWRQGNFRSRRFGPAADAARWARTEVVRRRRLERPLVWPLYSLRHHYANFLLKDLGLPLVVVSHWMGHRDPAVTSAMYVKQEVADMRLAAEKWTALAVQEGRT